MSPSSAQALEQDDVVGDGGAGDREACAVTRPGEVADGAVVREAKWVNMERLCCPFLILELQVSGTRNCLLKLRGPNGTKAVIEHELLKEFP
jgi:hypothetical protein